MGRISVTASPGATRTELVGRHGDGWKARVAAPPERGRANDELVRLIAAALDLPPSRVRVAAGAGARRKIVEVAGIDTAEIERRLSNFLEPS